MTIEEPWGDDVVRYDMNEAKKDVVEQIERIVETLGYFVNKLDALTVANIDVVDYWLHDMERDAETIVVALKGKPDK